MHFQPSNVLLAALLGAVPSYAMLDCKKIVADGHTFNLEKLSGPHSVVTSKYSSLSDAYHNTTYTLDVCQPLKKKGKDKSCPNGTRVCAIERLINGDTDNISEVVAIAGALEQYGDSRRAIRNPTRTRRVCGSSSKGGKNPLDGPLKERTEQKAIIEFLCDEKKTGTEGEWESEDKYEKKKRADKEDDEDKLDDKKDDKKDDDKEGDDETDDEDKDGETHSGMEHQLKKDDAALIWESYEKVKDAKVLHLTWHTKYACEKRDGDKDSDKDDPEDGEKVSAGWGFFTWLVIVVFLGTAAYLIFGSWLNYNRYGARGWDLLPHGDTIRDIPYLLKDWLRRVLNTVQGAGSRGGYSAV
ncbi:type II membrane protein [Lecanicillium sp. MT-2017a]|nr:type II membrane protein [Lecanicillium sp. MT-2017a]